MSAAVREGKNTVHKISYKTSLRAARAEAAETEKKYKEIKEVISDSLSGGCVG